METTPSFIQGIFPFTGAGLDKSAMLGTTATYMVPGDKRSQLIYLRAGNSSDELIVLTLLRAGKPMRLFPIGAKSAMHVSLAVVEDLEPDTRLDVFVAAPSGISGSVVLDIGLLEIT
jgi:assimilatory nitrate reductase catalytic subunit